MLELKTTFFELTLVICSIVFTYYFAKEVVKIVTKIIFTSKIVMAWNISRQLEQKKLIRKTELQQLNENINNLEQFLDWIGKHIPHNQQKSFWRDFARSKETRGYWVKTLRDTINQRTQQLEKSEQQAKQIDNG